MRTKDEAKEILILETALRLIAQTGLAGLKMADLAREAGVATGTVYIYFADKPALISRLYVYLVRLAWRDLTAGVTESDPVRIQVQKIARNYLNENINRPEFNAFFEQYYRSPFYVETDQTQTAETTALQPIYDVIRRGQAETVIKDLDPDLLVTLVCGLLNEAAKQPLYTGKPFTDADWDATFSVLWDGIKQ
ncbi:transcriptional regulator, TetR family [Fibrella aestuarina BUZ 2]|uniref:Transcriptional regulator, TetR family n=1 Tax=Fibrella aestuarina BUZ 2 TaxID=1166018 RepID=I0K625_9BACT|nr:TetR/AcrR family transcriptional regulator [Fibrella aestuarina]CCG99578.1 transcriptional regulator, TetR family [Fibrella aestuarina BUZ 2]